MTVWILHLALTPEEEEVVAARASLPLPLDGLPDLSMVASQGQFKHLLRALYPDDPPESLQLRHDRLWKIHAGAQKEDIIAVPLFHRREVALAEVIGPHGFEDGVHNAPVKWHQRRIAFASFRKHHKLLIPGTERLAEVEAAEARTLIRDRLPHAYNRFAGWKWLLIIFFLIQLVMMGIRLIGRQ